MHNVRPAGHIRPYLSFYLSIYLSTYIAPLQGNYSEALPAQAEEVIKRTGKVTRQRTKFRGKIPCTPVLMWPARPSRNVTILSTQMSFSFQWCSLNFAKIAHEVS